MRYSTGNPIGTDGSSDPRDLYDTAGIADLLVNGPLGEYLSRLGVPLKSWRGIMQQVTDYLIAQGYEAAYLNYAAGVAVLRQTQLVQRGGELYRVARASDLPLVLSGTWEADAPKLQAVGDAALRGALAGSAGTTIVGRGPLTLEQSLQSIEDGALKNRLDTSDIRSNVVSKNLSPVFFDMHYRALCGTGWLGNSVEIGGTDPAVTTASAPSSPGSSILSVTDVSLFRQGQLICYVGLDNTWYSAVVRRITGSQLQLDRGTAGVAAGASVIYFYANDAHPNIWGYYTIADTMIRGLSKKEEVVNIGIGFSQWSKLLGPETISPAPLGSVSAASYGNPGTNTQSSAAALVAVTDLNQGVRSSRVALSGGNYHTSLVINIGERTGSFSGALSARLIETTLDGQDRVIAFDDTLDGYSGIRVVDFTYTVRRGSSVSVAVVNRSGGGATFYLGQLRHCRVTERLVDPDFGTIVGFGDSWINSDRFLQRLRQRWPNANIINQGVSGNRMSQMVVRFMTDVAPLKPRLIVMIGGTNDYYAGVTPTEFSELTNQVLKMAEDIGAQVIVANASVGDATYAVAPFERLTASREYANLINFQDEASSMGWVGAQFRTANLWLGSAVSIPAGQTVLAGAIPAQTVSGAFLRSLFASGAGLQIRIGYSGIIDSAAGMTDVTAFAAGTLIRDRLLPKAGAASMFILVALNNPTGSAISTALVADIAWSEV